MLSRVIISICTYRRHCIDEDVNPFSLHDPIAWAKDQVDSHFRFRLIESFMDLSTYFFSNGINTCSSPYQRSHDNVIFFIYVSWLVEQKIKWVLHMQTNWKESFIIWSPCTYQLAIYMYMQNKVVGSFSMHRPPLRMQVVRDKLTRILCYRT